MRFWRETAWWYPSTRNGSTWGDAYVIDIEEGRNEVHALARGTGY